MHRYIFVERFIGWRKVIDVVILPNNIILFENICAEIVFFWMTSLGPILQL